MNESKKNILTGRIIELIQIVIGAPLVFIFGMCTIVSLFDKTIGAGGFLAVSLIMTVLGALCIFFAIKRHKLITSFKRYSGILSGDPSGDIGYIAEITGEPVSVVADKAQKMIAKGFFVNAYIDLNSNRIVLRGNDINPSAVGAEKSPEHVRQAAQEQPAAEFVSVVCPSCGGTNRVAKGQVGECEYCGSTISGQ